MSKADADAAYEKMAPGTVFTDLTASQRESLGNASFRRRSSQFDDAAACSASCADVNRCSADVRRIGSSIRSVGA